MWLLLAEYDFLKASFFLKLWSEEWKDIFIAVIKNYVMFNPKRIYADYIGKIEWKQIFPLTDIQEV